MTDREVLLRVNVGDGDKYTVILYEGGKMEYLRYGEPWGSSDVHGGWPDKFILTLAQEVDSLRKRLHGANTSRVERPATKRPYPPIPENYARMQQEQERIARELKR